MRRLACLVLLADKFSHFCFYLCKLAQAFNPAPLVVDYLQAAKQHLCVHRIDQKPDGFLPYSETSLTTDDLVYLIAIGSTGLAELAHPANNLYLSLA